MELEIKKIQLCELESFVKSETFNEFDTIPISKLRVESYLNNPAANSDDFVLYLGFIDKQLVAFRTIFAGQINVDPLPIRFGWCSGNWVHPDYRRKGYSEQLLNEALAGWNNKLMFTNYAPNSEQLYLKTGNFQVIHQFEGFRGYLFPKTRKLLSGANKNIFTRIFFSFIDAVIIAISQVRISFYNSKINPDITFEMMEFPDAMCLDLVEQNQSGLFFTRGKEELNWIFQYPWMTNNMEDFSAKYPFSSFSKNFMYQTVKIFDKNIFAGFFLFSVRNKHMKTLLFNVHAGLSDEIAGFIKNYCVQQKMEIITVYNFDIGNTLLKQKFPFLYARKYGQKIYSSFQVEQNSPPRFQDGDGDVIFT